MNADDQARQIVKDAKRFNKLLSMVVDMIALPQRGNAAPRDHHHRQGVPRPFLAHGREARETHFDDRRSMKDLRFSITIVALAIVVIVGAAIHNMVVHERQQTLWCNARNLSTTYVGKSLVCVDTKTRALFDPGG